MKVLEKAKIGNLELRNRIVMAPMGTKSDPDGGFCQRDIDYFVERAKGGTGLLITGRVATSTKYEMRSHHVLDNYHQVNRLAMLCEKVHIYGSKICVQIGPGLGRMVHQDPFNPPYSASAIPSHYFPELMCKPLSVEDIHYLSESVGLTAALAKTADADAVELHAYGGYLLDQFMTPYYNKRTDEYGGSLENRMRFTLECIRAIQKHCGKDFPLIVKYTANQAFDGGRTIEEGIEIGKMLEAAGVHALHVDKGCYECWYTQIPTVYGKEALQLEDAAAVKNNVGIPVIGHGKLHDPKLVDEILDDRKLDFIAMGHQMITDPHYVTKYKSNDHENIRPCIGCNECLYASHQGKDHTCAVNPLALREADYPVEDAKTVKNILVIGGGPGGLAAAITASKRGHIVELWEKNNKLGGNLLCAGAPSFKKDIMRYVNYLNHQVESLPIHVKLNTEATFEKLYNLDFDEIILACGSVPFVPPIRGNDKTHVTDAITLLKGEFTPGKRVVVIGGGLVGCETALHLSQTADEVTIVETASTILENASHCQNNDAELKKMIFDSKINVIAGAMVNEIKDDEVLITKDGCGFSCPCDSVIFATGFRPNNILEEKLLTVTDKVSTIGDAVRPRKIINAVHEGFHTARLI